VAARCVVRVRVAARRSRFPLPGRRDPAVRADLPAVVEGGCQALDPSTAAVRYSAADDQRAPRQRAAFQPVAGRACIGGERACLVVAGVLEDYILWVRHETDWKPATRNQRLLAVRLLLLEQAEDGLAGLPRGAVIHGSELPCVDPGLPKTIADDVFAQWIDPANLARLDERDRTLVLVLAFTGLRVSSVVTLMRDALQHGPTSIPTCATSTSSRAARRCCRSRRCSPGSSSAWRATWRSGFRRRSGCSPRRCIAARRAGRFTSTRARSRT
jgi:hypothetical protein